MSLRQWKNDEDLHIYATKGLQNILAIYGPTAKYGNPTPQEQSRFKMENFVKTIMVAK